MAVIWYWKGQKSRASEPLKRLAFEKNTFIWQNSSDNDPIFITDCNYNWLESTFTPGIFKRIERKNPGGAATSKPENVDEELSVQEQEDDQITI